MTTTAEVQPARRRRVATLIGLFPEMAAAKLLLNENYVNIPTSLEGLHTLWEQAAACCAQLPERDVSPYTLSTTEELKQYKRQLRKQPRYKHSFPYNSHKLVMVPIHRLVPAQYYIDIDYCENLVRHAPQPTTSDLSEVLHFLYGEGRWAMPEYNPSNDSMSLLFPGMVPNIDMKFTSIRQKENEQETCHTTLRLRSGFNHLHVALINSTHLVIVNGLHHACALERAGWQEIPCLVHKDLDMTLSDIGFAPDRPGVIPAERVLHPNRHTALSDFFDETIASSFDQYVVDQWTLKAYTSRPVFNKRPATS
jgi:hypothetical protein